MQGNTQASSLFSHRHSYFLAHGHVECISLFRFMGSAWEAEGNQSVVDPARKSNDVLSLLPSSSSLRQTISRSIPLRFRCTRTGRLSCPNLQRKMQIAVGNFLLTILFQRLVVPIVHNVTVTYLLRITTYELFETRVRMELKPEAN